MMVQHIEKDKVDVGQDLASLFQEKVKSPIIKTKLKDIGKAHRNVSVLRPIAIELLTSNLESSISE